MEKEALIKRCLICDDAIETYPFKDKSYGKMPIMRHKSNNKWFAIIFYLEKTLYINLKCKPEDAAMLRELYPFVTPSWHMNKAHWNKIDVKKAPVELLDSLIKASFDLTKK